MPRLRKKCSLAPEKRTASAMSADDPSAVINDGSSSRSSISEPARLRLWPLVAHLEHLGDDRA